MATPGNRGGGRRSKGERIFVGTRVPVNIREGLGAVAKGDNLSVSEYVEELITQDVLRRNFGRSEIQETLPIGRIA
jgi:hypothetical protein